MVTEAPVQQSEASSGSRRSLLDVLAGPLTGRALLLQVLAGLVLGAVVFGGLAGGLLLRDSMESGAEAPAALLFTGGSLGRAQAQAVTDDLGWAVTRTTHQGAGIGSGPRRGAPNLTSLIREDPDVKTADIVVVQGGEADTGMSPGELETAALHLLDWVQANKTEDATLVLVGPVPGTEQSPTDLQGVDGVLRDAAGQRTGVKYLSAISAQLSRSEPDFGTKLVAELRRLVPAR